MIDAPVTVAVVGSREPTPAARRFAGELASTLVGAGIVVVSGGAVGIDEAAHRGALRGNGRTWVVAATGHEHCFPESNRELFDAVAKGPGAMVWPFGPSFQHRSGFVARNRYLVAMSDAVVVVQAAHRSGSLNAAKWARTLGKPLWVVPAAPWLSQYQGSVKLLAEGARPLTSSAPLFKSLGLSSQIRTPETPIKEGAPTASLATPSWQLSEQESATLAATAREPRHTDAIAEHAGLSPQATAVALLTLALENVLVEGPPGFFRRRDGHNR